MSGRGLGHTGGTLDKLESIPGFRVELTTDEMVAQLRDVGVAIVGQSAHLVPADKKLYALRDVTATVDIVPLIASSIMSKKLAAGADAIVLDVKVGDGAFMKTLDDARVLAQEMLELGRRAGKEVTCLLTDMDQPLGRAVGNALEIREALDTVRGEGPADFTELVLDACARLLAYSDLGIDVDEGRRRAETAVGDGSALRGLRALDSGPGRRPRSPGAAQTRRCARSVPAPRAGVVTRLGALAVGVAALELGAGRRTKADAIDHAWACSALRSVATRCSRATTWRRCTHATRRRPRPPSRRFSRRTRSPTRRRPSAASCSTSSPERDGLTSATSSTNARPRTTAAPQRTDGRRRRVADTAACLD